MPINEVTTGDLLTSTKWNELVTELNKKEKLSENTFSGALTITESLNAKNATLSETLTVKTVAISEGLTAKNATLSETLTVKTVAITEGLTTKNATLSETLTVKTVAITEGLTAKNATLSETLTVKTVAITEGLTVKNATGTGTVIVDNLTVTKKDGSGKLTVDNLTITNKMNSLSVATAAVDSLTVANKMSNLNVITAAVDNLTVTNKMNSLAVGYLQVSGYINQNVSFYFYNGAGNTGRATGVIDCSIHASNRIVASEFDAHSDVRIKQKLHISNSKEDLAMLMQLKVTDYTMIDTVANGNRVSKKLIAQEVATVYPNAVSYTKGFIPNIYQLAQIENGFVTLPHPDLAIGDKVRLIFQDQQMEVQVSERDEKGFSVLADKPESKLPDGAVFVFGKEVDDFHTVDYDAITMLNTSATQALATKHAALQARLEAVETVLKTLKVESV